MDTVAPKKEQRKVEISSAEWQIMRIVWTLKHVTSTEIINATKANLVRFNNQDFNHATNEEKIFKS